MPLYCLAVVELKQSMSLHIIILAAGEGTRMKSRLPKVLHTVGGRPMIAHVLETAASLSPTAMHVVCNPESSQVVEVCDAWNARMVPQHERLGTGHAVMQAMPGVPDEARVLVLYADIPLVPAGLLGELIEAGGPGLALLTMEPADPAGYGRIVRDPSGAPISIVEEGDAGQAERAIAEVNSGILVAAAAELRRWLEGLGDDNSQGEFYLTDVIAAAHADGIEIASVKAPDPGLLEGVNDRAQLARLESRYRHMVANELMRAGVTITDPGRVDFRGDIEAGTDVRIDVNVVLEGEIRLGDGVTVAPGCVLRDCDLAAGTRVHPYSVLEGVRTLGACDIGPFARLRPGTELASGSRVGNFVEVKNTTLGQGSKASHLTYLGDSEIGNEVNIGAGTITCNYDGANKHRTVIEDGVFIGSGTELVAPVRIGRDATVGAGSTVTRDAPAGQLTVSRARQTAVKGWKRPKKEG